MDASIVEYPVTNNANNQFDSTEDLLESEKPVDGTSDSRLLAPIEDLQLEGQEDITAAELKDLFKKNTESFRCLAQILISRSSILSHPLYRFDPPVDPGIEQAFHHSVAVDQLDTVGIQTYKNYCKEYEIVPITRIIKSLPTDTMDLKYYGLSVQQIKALTAALLFNIYVENLILEENFLDAEALFRIGEMLRDNNKIVYLNMKNCWISPKAIGKLSEGIFTSQLVSELDLSYNNIKSSGLASLERSIRNNMSIKKLNLSHNGLLGDVCMKLGRALADNDCLEELDLSWNNLSELDGLFHLCQGLTEKDNIKSLNLSWNGISTKEAFIHVIRYMKATTSLEHIDLSNNQMQGTLIKMVRAGILGNSSLISINMSSNIISPEDASSLAHVFTASRGEITEPLKLIYLDMENVFVKKNFLGYWKKLTKQGKFIRIEGVLGNYKITGPDVKKLLFDRIRFLGQKAKKKKLRKEFGHFLHSMDKTVQEPKKPIAVDAAPSTTPDIGVMKADFLKALKKFKMGKVHKDQDLIKETLVKYTYNKDKINTTLMRKEYYDYYPDTTIPEIQKKKKGGKKGKRKKGTGSDTLTEGENGKDDSKGISDVDGVKKKKGVGLVFKEDGSNVEEAPQKTYSNTSAIRKGKIVALSIDEENIQNKSEVDLIYTDNKRPSSGSQSNLKESDNDISSHRLSTAIISSASKSILKSRSSKI